MLGKKFEVLDNINGFKKATSAKAKKIGLFVIYDAAKIYQGQCLLGKIRESVNLSEDIAVPQCLMIRSIFYVNTVRKLETFIIA